MDQPYSIETRSDLILALQEAAHIEHGLLLQYLFAAFSLKQSEAEGIAWDEVEQVNEWKRDILRIARDEMGHLATVMNMLVAVGSVPSFDRPPFPRPSLPWFPVPFELTRFSEQTLARFIRFESPAPMVVTVALERVAPRQPRYTYVGDFYRSIRRGFNTVSQNNPNLFLGAAGSQDQDAWKLRFAPRTIGSVRDAEAAIDALVEQGEGTPDGSDPLAHYATFIRIQNEFAEMARKQPGFDPARNVVSNPVLRPSGIPSAGTTPIDESMPCFEVGAIQNSLYILLLQVMQIYYDPHPKEVALRTNLQGLSTQLMMAAIRPLGELLTTLPTNRAPDSPRSGASFELWGNFSLPSTSPTRWIMLNERLDIALAAVAELTRSTPELSGPLAQLLPPLNAIQTKLASMRDQMNA
ncbi:hypothetical protein BWI17_18245 [Betaproteobacteria bacterium GR16-43]|nr:hypothetical protein BWI17_18245 [Betaproteobacteria bacterium GR16-43]